MKYCIKIWKQDEFIGWVSKNLTITTNRDEMLILESIPSIELSHPTKSEYEFIWEELFIK